MAKRLLIVGTSGYAQEVAQIARRIDPQRTVWHTISYVSQTRAELGTERLFGSVEYCDEDVLSGKEPADVVIGLGDPEPRQSVAARYVTVPSFAFPNVIDPSVDFDASVNAMGIGNVVQRNSIVAFNTSMGDFNMINKFALIGHEAKMGSFNTIGPYGCILGPLGDACFIGAGACVMSSVSVADRTKLGAAALLRHDITEPGQVFVGIPATKLR
jgi:acetyltransferase-like isoleucine patch superfamily enzyme